MTTVLFIGDSITDCGWRIDEPEQLGFGYVRAIAGQYLTSHPSAEAAFLNRGTNGERVRDLRARWDEDVMSAAPDLVSIMVGVNDTWRRYDSDDPTSVEDYEADYAEILEKSVAAGFRLVLMEPFLLSSVRAMHHFRDDLDPKIGVVRRLAEQFGAVLVGTDSVFAQYASHGKAASWAWDGVHPTAAGHSLLAQTWLSAVGHTLEWGEPSQ